MLRNYGFDFHLNGHEHFIAYAYLEDSTPLTSVAYHTELQQSAEVCAYEIEYFFNDTSQSRTSKWKKGEALHQITTGNTGKEDYSICYQRKDLATWTYAQNLYAGWTQVRTQADKITLLTQGYNPANNTILNLYEVTVTRGMPPAELAIVVTSSVLGGIVLIAIAVVLYVKFCRKKAPVESADELVSEDDRKELDESIEESAPLNDKEK